MVSSSDKLAAGQVRRFLVVGTLTVLLDYVVYRMLGWAGFDLSVAKAISFSVGAVFAYFANQHITFKANGSPLFFLMFCILYLATLACNVAVNALGIAFLENVPFGINLAFLFATAVSATLNFLGMKFLVFRA